MNIFSARSRHGFTLIEILVVMAIIGILATVGGGSYVTSRVRGRDAERKSSLGQVQRALELYYNDYGVYPQGDNAMISGCGANADEFCDWGGEFSDANNVYMGQLPSDPREPARQYAYETSSDGQKYRLYAVLENTRDLATDLNGDGTSGDSFNGTPGIGDGTQKTCGTIQCNYGVSSSSTNMSEVLE